MQFLLRFEQSYWFPLYQWREAKQAGSWRIWHLRHAYTHALFMTSLIQITGQKVQARGTQDTQGIWDAPRMRHNRRHISHMRHKTRDIRMLLCHMRLAIAPGPTVYWLSYMIYLLNFTTISRRTVTSVSSANYWKLKCMIYWLQLCSLCDWFSLKPKTVVFRSEVSHAWKMRWRHWRSECRSRSAEDIPSVNNPEYTRTSCTLHQCKRGMWVGISA